MDRSRPWSLVGLILMGKGKCGDLQNTSVNSVVSEKGSGIGMTMGWALVKDTSSPGGLKGQLACDQVTVIRREQGRGSCVGREVGPWGSAADDELRASIAEGLRLF